MEQSDPLNILCFGDSNTWGSDPADGSRFGHSVRWPGVLRAALGNGYHVIEEGLGGRTAFSDDPAEPGRNGSAYLLPCLWTHRPLDLTVLLLGTNDSKAHFNLPPEAIAAGIGLLVRMIQETDCYRPGAERKVLLIAPPRLAALSDLAGMFAGSAPKVAALPALYAEIAGQYGCAFLDSSRIIESSDLDGIHWEAPAHETLGLAVADVIRSEVFA